MRILHVPPGYYPYASGGTEEYVAALAAQLAASGQEVVITAPAQDGHASSYTHDGIPVKRFHIGAEHDVATLYRVGDPEAGANFGAVLDETEPDLVHLHAFSPATSLVAVREASRRGIPTVYTFHYAAAVCMRSTLMRWGTEVCDGYIDLDRCAACRLHEAGMPRVLAQATGHVPVAVGKTIGSSGLRGSAWTALRARELTGLFREHFDEYMQRIARVVIVAEWLRPVLLRNRVPLEKIYFSGQGLPFPAGTTIPAGGQVPAGQRPVRLALLTRASPPKGAHVAVEALAQAPEINVRLDVFALAQSKAGEEYVDMLRDLARGDSRVRFCPPVPHPDVLDTLKQYHLLVVPSQGVEVAPLVILEAFAAGTPVIASDLGGITEMVTNGKNGLLVQADSLKAWTSAFRRLASEDGLVEHLRSGIVPPRGMDDVALEMLALYRSLLQGSTEE